MRALTKPNFVGVGAMKCASTWVSECLRDHPQVLLSSPKETAYFYTRTGLDDYLGFFEGLAKPGHGYRAAGEFTPFYLPWASFTAPRIFETLGPVKILVSLRDPIARYLSHYKWVVGRRAELPRDEFVDLNMRTFARANSVDPRLLEFGRYCDSLTIYRETFGVQNVHVMIYEQIFADPQAELARLFSFLGVDPSFVPPSIDRRVREGYVPRSQLLEQAKVKTYLLLKNYAPWSIAPLKTLRLELLLKKINASKAEPLRVSPEVEDALADYYAEDIGRTRALLGQGLPSWGVVERG